MKKLFFLIILICAFQAEAQKKFKYLNKNCIEEFKFCVAYPADFKPETNTAFANGKKFTTDSGFLIQGFGRVKTKLDSFESLHQSRIKDINEKFKLINPISDTTMRKQIFFLGWETKEKEYIECSIFKGNYIKTIFIECPQGGLESRNDLLDVLGYFTLTATRNISRAK